MNSPDASSVDRHPAADAAAGAWGTLGWQARAFRVAHIVFGVLNMAALAYVWASAVKRRRDRWLRYAVGLLSAEGVALIVGRGNCPFGPFQRSLGDPVPMFELALPPRAAKAAIPVLAVISVAGFGALALRGHRNEGRLIPEGGGAGRRYLRPVSVARGRLYARGPRGES
jgi:hypothetical protein